MNNRIFVTKENRMEVHNMNPKKLSVKMRTIICTILLLIGIILNYFNLFFSSDDEFITSCYVIIFFSAILIYYIIMYRKHCIQLKEEQENQQTKIE